MTEMLKMFLQEPGARLLGALGWLALVLPVLAAIWKLTGYILTGLSLHTLARRRELAGGWLAWVPVARYWVLGALSDQYERAAQGRVRRRRRTLMGLIGGRAAGTVLFSIFSYTAWFLAAQRGSGRYVDDASVHVLGVTAAALALGLCIMLVVFLVQKYLACFQVFRSSRPGPAVVFLVLGILFPGLVPFFLLACRNQDQGLPQETEAVL